MTGCAVPVQRLSAGLGGLWAAGGGGGCALALKVLRVLGGVQLVVPGDPALQVLRMSMLLKGGSDALCLRQARQCLDSQLLIRELELICD